MRQTYQILIVAGLILLISMGLLISNLLLDIEKIPPGLLVTDNADIQTDNSQEKPVVLIGVISRYAPYLIYEGYQPIMDYLTDNSEYTYTLRLSSSYQDAADKLINGEVAASFFGTKIYLDMSDRAAIEPILAPVSSDGTPFIQSILITSSSSSIMSLDDISGKSIALPSQLSFSGQWGMIHLIKENYLDTSSLGKMQHFAHHQTVVYKVLKNEYDIGVVKDRVAEEYADKGIRILSESPPFPSSPIVTMKSTDDPAITVMKDLLLRLNPENEEDRMILDSWDPEFAYGFTEVSADLYAGVKKSLQDSLGRIFK